MRRSVQVTSTLAQAVDLWQQGLSQIDIARACGVSRQRIQQLMAKHPELFGEREWATSASLAREYAISHASIRGWVEADIVRHSPSGLVSVEDVQTVTLALLDRPCAYPGCEDVINTLTLRQRFCATCSQKVKRYRYPVMDAEERKRTHTYGKRWQQKNPERWAAINKRAQAAYRARRAALEDVGG
jgi:transcriptional regulator with XRE-family HTH domain